MTLFTPRYLVLAMFIAIGFGANAAVCIPMADSLSKAPAVRKSAHTAKGDKKFAKLKFDKAIKQYTKAIANDDDSLKIMQKLAESYKLVNKRAEAEKIYAKLADNPKANPINKYYYAEMLKGDKNYSAAMKYYTDYVKAVPSATVVKQTVGEPVKMQELSKDNGAYKIELLKINSPKSEYSPAFYKDSMILFSSNRSSKKAVYDKWSLDKNSKVYVAGLDSNATAKQLNLKGAGNSFKTGSSYNSTNNEVIYAAGSFKKKKTVLQNGKKLPATKLYSTVVTGNSTSAAVPLAVNGDQFSNAQPSVTKDGKTLYFASDRVGGQGGTDLYVSTRNANGTWSDPKNLGADVNTQYDEKFPFIADDGTLYFSSNSPSGIGGLDIYKTRMVDGKWVKPENLGAPVNSPADDFSFVIDKANKNGFFASNRTGGKGEDDIYRFAFDETKLDYSVTIRVVDANTLKPIPAASLDLDCKTANAVNTLAGSDGEKKLFIDAGKKCTISAWSPGYKNNSVELTSINRNGLLMVELTPETNSKVTVMVKEQGTMQPVKEITITATGPDNTSINYSTGNTGSFEMAVAGAGTYKLTSPDYPNVAYQYSSTEGNTKEILISEAKKVFHVPLNGEGITTPVQVSNVQTGQSSTVQPNNGEVRLDLDMNTTYKVAYENVNETISTKGLVPGTQVKGTKFHVGQTWVLPNIYYDLNKWNIRKDAAQELDKLVKLMKENPTLEIELSSHTDCRAGARYNVVLSARRAKAAIDYVRSKGIKAKRFIAAGYGESRLTNNCYCEPTNASICTLDQHQANRRTEVKILKY